MARIRKVHDEVAEGWQPCRLINAHGVGLIDGALGDHERKIVRVREIDQTKVHLPQKCDAVHIYEIHPEDLEYDPGVRLYFCEHEILTD